MINNNKKPPPFQVRVKKKQTITTKPTLILHSSRMP